MNKDSTLVGETGIPEDVMKHIGTVFSTPPDTKEKFELHKGIERILKGRSDLLKERSADWALAEAFAFGSSVQSTSVDLHVNDPSESVGGEVQLPPTRSNDPSSL